MLSATLQLHLRRRWIHGKWSGQNLSSLPGTRTERPSPETVTFKSARRIFYHFPTNETVDLVDEAAPALRSAQESTPDQLRVLGVEGHDDAPN